MLSNDQRLKRPAVRSPSGVETDGFTFPDLRGLLLVALVCAWLVGIFVASFAALPFWLLVGAGAGCGGLASLAPWLGLRGKTAGWLALSFMLLACAALGAARLALANPTGDASAVSSFIGRGTVVLRGTVNTAPIVQAHSTLFEVGAHNLSLDGGHAWQQVHGSVALVVAGFSSPYEPEYGDSIEVRGVLEPVFNGSLGANPPAASSSRVSSGHALYLVAAPAGVFAAMHAPRMTVLERGGGNPVLAWFFNLRQGLAQAISRALPEPEASLLIGILLGLKTSVLRAQYLLLQETGTVHLFVSSGFKVTLLSGLLSTATVRLPGRRWALGIVLVGIALYIALSGFGPAALRAGIMGALLVIAPRLGRRYNMYTALAFAAWVMTALSPYLLWDVGFQLTLLGTLGILLLAPPIIRRLERPLSRIPGSAVIARLLAVPIAAQLATLPIQVINFGLLSLIAPLVNLLTVPLLGLLLCMGVLVAVVGLAIPAVGAVVGWVCWPLLWLVEQIITGLARVPFASIALGGLDTGLAWLYYAALGLFFLLPRTLPRPTGTVSMFASLSEQRRFSRRERANLRLAGATLLLVAAISTTLATLPDQRLRLIWLDVGAHGQALLIQTPGGQNALVDGGSDPSTLETALGEHIPFWQHTLNLVVLTNPGNSYLAGLLDLPAHYHILQEVDAGMLHPSSMYAAWHTTLEQQGIPFTRIRQGANIQIEPGISLQVLSPGPVLDEGSNNVNANALVLRLASPGLSALLLGETTDTVLGRLSLEAGGLQARLVQVALPPGASPESTLEMQALLRAIQPGLIVVTPAASAGPSEATQDATEQSTTVAIYTLASTGTLAISADSSGWWIEN
jgi:competence protein ComEC